MTANTAHRIYMAPSVGDDISRPARTLPAQSAPAPLPLRASVVRAVADVVASANTNAAIPSSPNDASMLQILTSPPEPGETLHAAFRRKEHELLQLFHELPVLEARALHRRLTIARPGDPLAASFSRLVSERRARLLAFLADARRREALNLARRS